MLVWIAGRVVVACSAHIGWLAAMLVDGSFLSLAVIAAAREIAAGKNWRNLPVVGFAMTYASLLIVYRKPQRSAAAASAG